MLTPNPGAPDFAMGLPETSLRFLVLGNTLPELLQQEQGLRRWRCSEEKVANKYTPEPFFSHERTYLGSVSHHS